MDQDKPSTMVEISREEYNRLRSRSAMLDTVQECYDSLFIKADLMIRSSISAMDHTNE